MHALLNFIKQRSGKSSDPAVVVIVAKMRCNRQLIALAILAGLFMCATAEDAAAKRGPKITTKVFFDIEIDGKEAGMCHFALQLMVD